MRRTSVVKHYGVRTLLYGTLLPGPDIGRRAADVMQGVRDAGHETGVHCWDHIRWQDGVSQADERGCDDARKVDGAPPERRPQVGMSQRDARRINPIPARIPPTTTPAPRLTSSAAER